MTLRFLARATERLGFTRLGKIVGGTGVGEKMENLILAVLDVKCNRHVEMLSGQSHNSRVGGGRSAWR